MTSTTRVVPEAPRRALRRRALLGAALTTSSALMASCSGGRPRPDEGEGPAPAPSATTDPPVASPSAPPAGGTLGLGVVGIVVVDLGASLAFYRRLGLDVPEDRQLAGGNFRLQLPTGQILFWETLEYIRGFDPTYRASTGDRRIVLEFGFARRDDVTSMYDRLTADGHPGYLPPTSWDDDTISYAIVVDPDGNQISLRWPLIS